MQARAGVWVVGYLRVVCRVWCARACVCGVRGVLCMCAGVVRVWCSFLGYGSIVIAP